MKTVVYSYWEISSVCLDITRTPEEAGRVTEPETYCPLQLRPDEARALAAKLVAAAEEIEKQDAELETFFQAEQNPWCSASTSRALAWDAGGREHDIFPF
jgi:hypothetical protein